jgi:CheY-like chemotaxis protein
MFSDIKLSFSDAPNLQKLFVIIFKAAKAKPENIRILTNEDFIRKFIFGTKDYSEIKIATNLQFAIDDLLAGIGKTNEYSGATAELIGDRILRLNEQDEDEENMVLKFNAEEKKISYELFKDSLKNLKIAVTDDDFVIHGLIKNIFERIGSTVFTFSDGDEFLAEIDGAKYDLAFLDLKMPKVDGFGVLKALQGKNIPYPVIVLSSINQRDTMVKAIQMGVKSYLVKPLKPEDVFNKSIEILKVNY